MKKLTLLIAALVLTFTAQATVVNCNPGTNNLSWFSPVGGFGTGNGTGEVM